MGKEALQRSIDLIENYDMASVVGLSNRRSEVLYGLRLALIDYEQNMAQERLRGTIRATLFFSATNALVLGYIAHCFGWI